LLKLVYVGDHFYLDSGTIMSSLYTEDGMRSDWGKVNVALRNGEGVHIRQANEKELDLAKKQLEHIKNFCKKGDKL
jgi:hypothetical protein